MACQPNTIGTAVQTFQYKARLTNRRISVTRRDIHRIEAAKKVVCGVVSNAALDKLRHDFEALLPLFEEEIRCLRSGELDAMSDDQLVSLVDALKRIDSKTTVILEGSVRIGLEAIEPFPKLLWQLREMQETLQSQIEGIMLSLDELFQESIERAAQDLRIPA